MKVTRAQIDRAMKTPANVRLFLFHGPDEAGSRAIARRVPAAMGVDVERIELSGSELKADPARLSDEAAAISMFGTSRCILVSPAGDDSADAAAVLLDAPAGGNPVVLLAGALKPTSRLLKLALAHPAALVFASAPMNARDLELLVVDLAKQRGLSLRPDVAGRIAAGAAGDRGIVEQELDKYALYLDAVPGSGAALEGEVVEAVGAALDDGDMTSLVTALFDGNAARVEAELARLRSEGSEGITLIRAALRRAIMIARAQGGGRPDQGPIDRQASAWRRDRLARAFGRLLDAENEVKAANGLGPLATDAAMIGLARQAGRRG